MKREGKEWNEKEKNERRRLIMKGERPDWKEKEKNKRRMIRKKTGG